MSLLLVVPTTPDSEPIPPQPSFFVELYIIPPDVPSSATDGV